MLKNKCFHTFKLSIMYLPGITATCRIKSGLKVTFEPDLLGSQYYKYE